MKICKIDGCTAPVNARGWCSTHYNRWLNTGSTDRVCLGCGQPVQDGRTRWCSADCKPRCSFDGCTKPAYARNGLCAGHDRQLRETGELRPFKFERPPAGGNCTVCNQPIPDGQRRKTCSAACRQRLFRHSGSRPREFQCIGCGKSVSLTHRHGNGQLRRSDSKWCMSCLSDDNRRRMYRYGVTPERFTRALADGCEICGRTGVSLHVDHDHSCCPGEYTCGNCVRGFICGSCNRAIGLLLNSPDVMLAAATYILKAQNVLASDGIVGGELNCPS